MARFSAPPGYPAAASAPLRCSMVDLSGASRDSCGQLDARLAEAARAAAEEVRAHPVQWWRLALVFSSRTGAQLVHKTCSALLPVCVPWL